MMGIRGKFTVLLVCSFLVFFACFLMLLSFLLHDSIHRQIQSRLRITTGLVGAFGFSLQTNTLERLKDVVDADVLIIQFPDMQGDHWNAGATMQVASSLSPEQESELMKKIMGSPELRTFGDVFPADAFQEAGFQTVCGLTQEAEPKIVYLLADRDETSAMFQTLARQITLVATILMVFIGILTVSVAGAVIKPLRALSAQTQEVAKGNLEIQVDINSNDEIGVLARSFNSMTRGLRDVQQNLIHTEKMAALGQLTTGVAHEIKNPLASLKLTVELLLKREQDESKLQGLQNMLSDIERLQRYLDEMLEYAHPDELRLRTAQLNDVVQEVMEFLRPQFKHIRIDVQLQLQESLPDTQFDPAKLKQVIMNLVLNAAQASTPGQHVEVVTAVVESKIRLTVRDHGPGVASDAAAKLFEPFFTTKNGGTGLGLSVSKNIMEDHGGRIGYDSTSDGSLFWIELPRQEE